LFDSAFRAAKEKGINTVFLLLLKKNQLVEQQHMFFRWFCSFKHTEAPFGTRAELPKKEVTKRGFVKS
jgi:hypothetical protein